MRCHGRELTDEAPRIGKWVDCDVELPPIGQPVLGWWGGLDVESVMRNSRNDSESWWETRAGDTAQPAAWAPIDVSLWATFDF